MPANFSSRYVIQRALEQGGITCYVLPANKVAKKRTDRIKTDKRDARLIGRELRSKSIKPISVPNEDDEAVRDLMRCREDIGGDMRRAKQRLLKFMVRHGHIYNEEKNHWTKEQRTKVRLEMDGWKTIQSQ